MARETTARADRGAPVASLGYTPRDAARTVLHPRSTPQNRPSIDGSKPYLGANARAALITRGVAEITRLGVALGANPLTFLGMAGVGDLILTCTGERSRNRTLGKQIAAGVDPQQYLASKKSVADGYYTAAAAHALSQKLGVEMPITENVYHVLHQGRLLPEAVRVLLERTYKDELHGID